MFVEILLYMALALILALVLWMIYAIYWAARFGPYFKAVKLQKERLEMNRDYEKIEAKKERITDELFILRKDYSDAAVKNRELEVDLVRKQELLKKYADEITEFQKWKDQGAPKAVEEKEPPKELPEELEKEPQEDPSAVESPKKLKAKKDAEK